MSQAFCSAALALAVQIGVLRMSYDGPSVQLSRASHDLGGYIHNDAGLHVTQHCLYIQGMSSLRSLIPFRLSHLLETSAHV